MPEWVTKYWIEWLFGVFAALITTLVSRLFSKLKKERAEREAIAAKAAAETAALKDGMRAILRRQIIADCKAAMRAGYCEETAKDTITAMYHAYKGLEGNGTAEEAYNSMMALPLVPIAH